MTPPFNYNLSASGLRVTGGSRCPDEVRDFAARLVQLAEAMEAMADLGAPA